MPTKAIFLDRDGTLNRDTGYVFQPKDWIWLDKVPETLARLHAWGWFLVVVSNQSGIARNYYTASDLHALEQWVNSELKAWDTKIDAWYHCPHLPEITGPCSCRKPDCGMLLRAACDHHISLKDSWMIGDRVSDVQAGIRANVRCIKIATQKSDDDMARSLGAYVLPNLAACLDLLRI